MPILVPFFPCFVRPHRSEGHQGLPVISQVLAQKPTAATTQPRVLVCRKRKNGVDLSVKSSSRTGWIGRLLHGREQARLQRRLGWEIAWCEKHLGHWPEVGAALELLQSERAASPDRCLNTVQLRAALQVLKAAQGRFLDISGSVKAMRAHRDAMKAMAPSELRASVRQQDGHSAARTADRDEACACNCAWAQAVPDGASGGAGRARTAALRRFIDQRSQARGQTPLQFLRHVLLLGTASFNLRPRVFEALLTYFVERGVQGDMALAVDPQRGDSLDQLLEWLAPVVPQGQPLAPAMTQDAEGGLAPMSARAFASALSATLHGPLAELSGEPVDDGLPEEAQWRRCIEGVLCCQVDGVYLDTPQFRGALARLVRVKNERVAVQAREQPLMRLARRLEAAYLGHRERVLALDGLDIWREWGDGDQRRAYAAIAARLDKAFTPKDAPEGPLDVEADEVEAFVAAYTTDNDPSPAPHQILHLWLTETLVPRYLSPPVFQALARYCMRAQLQEAAQAPL
ncbi:hypothetical protein JNX00_04250 [Hydrogenophaga sp. YM1]|uniref:hypothetical protein n=1 Tax=Hydrogenophaga sp. YM1 TaxID=2806262 RepID=UPI00195BB866|nr:hypothetical protein [Hydrogenophaga sp. YM1]QRR35096.1 hypothetical protein JNX00_04250 [Hydrogenophaga sp. YM1]